MQYVTNSSRTSYSFNSSYNSCGFGTLWNMLMYIINAILVSVSLSGNNLEEISVRYLFGCCPASRFFFEILFWFENVKNGLNRVNLTYSIYQQLPFTKRSALFYNSVHALFFCFQMLPYMILDYSLSVFLKKLWRAHLVFFQLG